MREYLALAAVMAAIYLLRAAEWVAVKARVLPPQKPLTKKQRREIFNDIWG